MNNIIVFIKKIIKKRENKEFVSESAEKCLKYMSEEDYEYLIKKING